MYASAGVAPTTWQDEIPIETMRALAVILLVSFHVIGSDPNAGLTVGYPNMLRLFADFFIDLRMPFFAFIAGYVYALRPLVFKEYPKFIQGKLRRLYIPCAIAAVAFLIASNVMQTRFALPLTEGWKVFMQSYVHFWFLQAILVIFVLFGLVDTLLRGRFSVVALIAAAGVSLSGLTFDTVFFSLNGAIYLSPYFLLGIVFLRYAPEVIEMSEKLTLVLIVTAVICMLVNIQTLYETGTFSLERRDAQSLFFGVSICALAMMWSPRLAVLERLSPYAFTIYLYHVFGTVGGRILCNQLNVTQLETRFLICLAGGILLPIVLHETVSRLPMIRRPVLGR